MKKAICPSCKQTIQLPAYSKALDLVTCSGCQALLEVVRLFPAILKWADDPVVFASHRKPLIF